MFLPISIDIQIIKDDLLILTEEKISENQYICRRPSAADSHSKVGRQQSSHNYREFF